MDDLKEIIGNNITNLRKITGMTQLQLADKLNYSDKAVSKWERGESIPDVIVLKKIADIFSVTVNYLLEEEHDEKDIMESHKKTYKIKRRNRIIVTLLAISIVWAVATMVFVYLGIYTEEILNLWIIFVYAVPISLIVLLVFNSIWGVRRSNFLIITCLVWTLLLAIYLSLLSYNLWLIFLLGIPAQIIIILWSGLKTVNE